MSQIPRRTSEFQSSSVRNSTNPRTSRLTQASAIPSSALRGTFARASATPSRTRMTPSRTPIMKNRDTMLNMPQTAEKEKAPVDDKCFIQQKTQQVLDELAKVGGFTDLVQKGLKSMTHKQFIMILQHFLKPIVPNVHLDGSNYVEYISNFLVTMEYPYAGLSKSSLRTPSAPHCQNSIIVLLAWFTEFSLTEIEAESVVQHCVTEDFSKPEISKMFMQKTAFAFELWNEQKSADEVLDQIRTNFIERNLGSGGDLETELNRLKSTINDLKKEAKPVSLQNRYNDKREEMKRLKQRTDELTKINSDLNHRVNNAAQNLESKRAAEVAAGQEMKKLQQKQANQKMTLDEKNKFLMEITQAKSVLASKRTAAMEINEVGMQNEIQLSNLLQKKFQLIDKLNNLVYKIASDFAGVLGDFDPEQFEIKTKRIGDADALESELDMLQQGLIELNSKYKQEISAVNQNHMKIDGVKHRLITENEMKTVELTNLKVSLEKVTNEEAKIEQEVMQYVHEMEKTCRQTAAEIKEIGDDIQQVKQNIARLYEVNKQRAESKATFKAKSLEQCRILFEKRKEEVEYQRKQLTEINIVIEQFKKQQKPFPENIQRVIDGVMKKRENKENQQ